MEKTSVTCPNCGEKFEIGIDAEKGRCPYCGAPLIYEEAMEGMVEEFVDIGEIERKVDSLIRKRYISHRPSITDVEVIKGLKPDIDYESIDKAVDEIKE